MICIEICKNHLFVKKNFKNALIQNKNNICVAYGASEFIIQNYFQRRQVLKSNTYVQSFGSQII